MTEAPKVPELKWAQMQLGERTKWCGKLLVALLTCGFVYPNVMSPHIKDD